MGDYYFQTKKVTTAYSSIDYVLSLFGDDCKSHAIGIILSGTGSDGANGIGKIHDSGGLVIVQSEDSAKFNGIHGLLLKQV